jgi:hypothetical protein
VPLLAGETPTPLACLVLAGDSASGVAVVVDPRAVTFVNGDLTIALHRGPVGEWICLDAATTGEPHGIGLTRARLWDTAGLVGRSLQTLLLEPRIAGWNPSPYPLPKGERGNQNPRGERERRALGKRTIIRAWPRRPE